MASPDQAFGWFVPLLAIYLGVERWRRGRLPAMPSGAERAGGTALFAVGCGLVLTNLPVLEANTLWPTAQWWGAAGAALATIGAATAAGGWAWARQFVFPPLFIFTALTWPTPIKSWIVANLEGINAETAAGIVSAAGHPAIVTGNVIRVSTGLVGIEEACSGLRSLQTVWMVAWFAGEFFLLNLPRRLFLVFAAMLTALAANLARTIFLTWMAADAGLTASERWHDRAGNLELAFDLAMVAALAWRAHRPGGRRRTGSVSGRPPIGAPAANEVGRVLRTRSNLRPSMGQNAVGPGALETTRSTSIDGAVRRGQRFALAALLVGLAAEAGTRAWYGSHARGSATALVHWRLAAPNPDWTAVPVPPRELAILQSTQASGLAVRPPQSEFPAWVFVVSWEGSAARSENPEWHDPAICLPAAGARLTANLGPAEVALGTRQLSFAGYRFEAGGRTETVYFCHWDAENAAVRQESDGSRGDVRARRWQRVREGRRQGDVAHIAFVIETPDAAAALTWLRRWAPLLLLPVS
jgi:exosortase